MHAPDSLPFSGLSHLQHNIVARREFVAWLGAVVTLSACGRIPQALTGPAVQNGNADAGVAKVTNVRDAGALGDGVQDDTAAFNAAVKSLGSVGGEVAVPAGVYLIDPLTSIRLPSNVTLLLDDDAILQAIPVAAGSSSVVLISGANNVKVIGGKIIGERAAHLGTTGEWGMGIRIVGSSDVRIEGVQASDGWGDGIYVGALGPGRESTNIAIANVMLDNNRRQGISITGCVGATIDGCVVTHTNGTAPSAGIDLEPNSGLRVTDVIITNSTFAQNAGPGIQLVERSTTNVVIESNRIAENGGAGIYLVRGVSGCTIQKNRIERSARNGVLFENAHNSEITSNIIRDNGTDAPNALSNIRLAQASSNNTIADNQFGLTRLIPDGVPDIEITQDCADNLVAAPTRPSRARPERG